MASEIKLQALKENVETVEVNAVKVAPGDVVAKEQPLLEVQADKDQVSIAAPQPLSLGPEMPVELVASCVGLKPGDVITEAHRPVSASVGNSFVIAEVSGGALMRAVPDLGRFRDAAQVYTAMGPNRLPIYLYAHDGARIRTRMFSPLSGTVEDPATGSAATPLAALLHHAARRAPALSASHCWGV